MKRHLTALATVTLLSLAACGPADPVPVSAASPSPSTSIGLPAAATHSPASSLSPSPTTPPFFATLPATPTLVSATLDGAVTQNARVGGRDDGQSTRYGDRSVWIFADTTFKSPWGFLSNSGAATRDLDAGDGITLTSAYASTVDSSKAPVTLIPHTAAEQAFETKHSTGTGCAPATDQFCGAQFGFWPGPVIADPTHNRVLVLFGKLCRGGATGTPCSGPLGKGLGTGIAAVDMTTGAVTRPPATHAGTVTSVEGADPTMLFGADSGWSSAALTVGTEAYLYGDCTYHGCHLAKVPLAQLTDRAAWTFWTTSHTWSPDKSTAADTIAPGAAGETVFYDPALKSWLNVYMPYGTNDVDYQVGGSPFGPWSSTHKALTTPTSKAHDYSLYGHPEYAQQNGLVQYLSYFHTDTGAQNLVKLVFKPA